ncbi:MAG: tRNA (adenosine(37)-N6)-dimethylallyltransferase MiaA [Bacteroidota bacterium]|nr:tRNA (adenosine(37)-N6)-dimethylallyltransferase MiaA [Bacteroidota bacterium]
MKSNLIVIVGPTAVGKTALGIALAHHFGTEIISSDSRQMFREMHIGTAAPTEEELSQAVHHFVKNKSLSDYYNASMFEFDVMDLLVNLFRTNDKVLMVGGSTLYVDAVCYGIDDLPSVDHELRKQIMERFKEEGIEYLRQQLKQLDPEHYLKVDLKNPNRMMKAIEISLMTGKPYSSHLTASRKERDFNIIKLGINRPRAELFDRINRRVEQMVTDGLIGEVKSLIHLRETNGLKTVGYREIFDYLDGTISLEQAIENIKTNTRRYAKRQITWFSRDKEMVWFHPDNTSDIISYIESKL